MALVPGGVYFSYPLDNLPAIEGVTKKLDQTTQVTLVANIF